MRLITRQAFTLFELMVTIAVLSIASSLVLRSMAGYMQEQHLRQAANELVSYLLIARSRALRDANVPGKACELELNPANNTVAPTAGQVNNVCNDPPGLPVLDLLANSGGSDLQISSSDGNYLITFTRMGTIASSNLTSPPGGETKAITLPRIFYFSNSNATEVRRCVLIGLNSFAIGWRNSKPTAGDQGCTYNGY
jgi:prepilin-type N-terminal cleavage/methylation domain-containing protein